MRCSGSRRTRGKMRCYTAVMKETAAPVGTSAVNGRLRSTPTCSVSTSLSDQRAERSEDTSALMHEGHQHTVQA